jgi:hypothetical protein
LELARNGLMYCQNCRDYWRKWSANSDF